MRSLHPIHGNYKDILFTSKKGFHNVKTKRRLSEGVKCKLHRFKFKLKLIRSQLCCFILKFSIHFIFMHTSSLRTYILDLDDMMTDSNADKCIFRKISTNLGKSWTTTAKL